MKKVIGSICSALFCLGVIGVEYEMALLFGSMLILFSSVAFSGALLVAVFRAPEGYEWLDGISHLPARPGVATCSQYSPLPTSPCGEINLMRDASAPRSSIYLSNCYTFVIVAR